MFRYQYSANDSSTLQSRHSPGSGGSGHSFSTMLESVRADLQLTSPPTPDALIKCPLDHLSRSIVYADYTASGRALRSVENYIQSKVLPWYGNTHSVSSATARQSTHFREEARHIIRNYFNCTEANAVIFVGAGVTAGIAKFVALIESGVRENTLRPLTTSQSTLVEDRWGSLVCSLCNVRVKNEAMYRSHCSSALHQEKSAKRDSTSADSPIPTKVVFLLDHMSHHSALLPFRELSRRLPDTFSVYTVSVSTIDSHLESIASHTVPIAIMCAMSNITGERVPTEVIHKLNRTVHARGGIVCWDLATYASHHRFDMNPSVDPLAFTDFAFVSPHKLVGGPGAAGVMLARREWMRLHTPTVPGGGVVFFTSAAEESYIQNSEEREEAGTPDIIGCIRAGLVFALHERVDFGLIAQRETALATALRQKLSASPEVHILGPSDIESPLVSFNIKFKNSSKWLHHNFVVALLNDLFGIQARGGCACAGPFAQELLGLSPETTAEFHRCLQQSGQEVFRPGFVRLGVHWTMTEAEVGLIGDAVVWIAENGWRVMSVYAVDTETGEWAHRIAGHDAERIWLSAIDFFTPSSSTTTPADTSAVESFAVPMEKLIDSATAAMARMHEAVPLASVREAVLDANFSDLVWFALPMDSVRVIQGSGPLSERGSIYSIGASVSSAEAMTVQPVEAETTSLAVKSAEVIRDPRKKHKPHEVPRKLRAVVTSAIIDYSMIKEGDRVLIGISGGKDSLSLLHILRECQKKCPFRFEIACATVDPMVPEYQPQPLIAYMESLGMKYHFLQSPIMEIAKTAMTGKQSICSFCSRMKRGMLYNCMRQNGYNVLALGQHLDDLVESFLMSCFRNGTLRTMKANYLVKEKDIRVIRPLVYVREKMTTEFAKDAQLPIIRDNCPACFAAPKERHRVKMLLSNEEFQNNHLFASMLQAIKPLVGISSAMSTRELIEGKLFPIADPDEDEDQGAEEVLLPCSGDSCPIPNRK